MTTDNTKLEWMYQGPAGRMNREDYLLGKKLDKNYEQNCGDLVKTEGATRFEMLAMATKSDKDKAADSDKIVLDLETVKKEDPLVAIKVQEENVRRELMNNPMKMKRLHKFVMSAMEKKMKKEMKKQLKKEKKESKRAAKAESQSVGSNKYGRSGRLDDTASHAKYPSTSVRPAYDERDDVDVAREPRHGHSDDQDRFASRGLDSRSRNDGALARPRHGDDTRIGRSGGDWSRTRDAAARPRDNGADSSRNADRSWTRDEGARRRPRHDSDSRSHERTRRDSSGSAPDDRRDRTGPRKANARQDNVQIASGHRYRDNNGHSSRDTARRDSGGGRWKETDGNAANLPKERTRDRDIHDDTTSRSKPDGNSKLQERKRRSASDDSGSSGSTPDAKRRQTTSRDGGAPTKTDAKRPPESSSSSSEEDFDEARAKMNKRVLGPQLMPPQRKSRSPSRSDSEEDRKRKKFSGYGLVNVKKGPSPAPNDSSTAKDTSSKPLLPLSTSRYPKASDAVVKKASPPRKKKPLTEKEMEQKRQEMTDNAKWREQQRSKNLDASARVERAETEREARAKAAGEGTGSFIRPLLADAAQTGSVAARIKSNRQHAQRTTGTDAMSTNFARRT